MFPFKFRSEQDRKTRREGVNTFLDAISSGTTNNFAIQVAGARHQIRSGTAESATFLAAKPQTRFRILGFSLSAANAAAGTSTGVTITCTVDGATYTLGACALAASAANSNTSQVTGLHVMTDVNTPIAVTNVTAAPTTLNASIYYQEILEQVV